MVSYVAHGLLYVDGNEISNKPNGRWYQIPNMPSIIQYTRVLWFTIAIDSDHNLWFMQDGSLPEIIHTQVIHAEIEPIDTIRAVTTSGDRVILQGSSIPEPVRYPNKLWKLCQNHVLDIFGNLYDGSKHLVETDVVDISPIHGCGTENGMLALKSDGTISGRNDVWDIVSLGYGCALDKNGIIWFIGLSSWNLSEEYNIQPVSDVAYLSNDGNNLMILYNDRTLEIHYKGAVEIILGVECLSHQVKRLMPNRKNANKR